MTLKYLYLSGCYSALNHEKPYFRMQTFSVTLRDASENIHFYIPLNLHFYFTFNHTISGSLRVN